MSAGFLEWFSEEARRLYGEVSHGPERKTERHKYIKTDRTESWKGSVALREPVAIKSLVF
jgi:hypothetical protein